MEVPQPRRPSPPFEYEATVTSVETTVSRHVILYSWHNCADVSVETVAFALSVAGVVWLCRGVWRGDPWDLCSWPQCSAAL